ncbi:pyocin activator PrtN family protein [Citrobacter portucalensis]|nr:pyocin activator PrtN family protein [Citrobacter portucalensis]MBW7639091.1 pyocin activator PrtN family protein [Citrobacter portucalensis]
MMVISMNELNQIPLEQYESKQRRIAEAKAARHPSGLYRAGDGWFSRKLEVELSPLGLSKTNLVSPEQVCERYQRQYGKPLSVDELKAWANAGNFPLPRSVNGVVGWTAEVVTTGLNDLSRISGKGFTSVSRAGSLK